MSSIDDNLHAKVQVAEAELKHGRCQLIQYLSYKSGKFDIDPRYSGQFAELQQRESSLRKSIESIETAMERAAELVKQFKGANQSTPLSWLQLRLKALQGDINQCETDLTVYKKRIEVHGDIKFPEYKDRIKEIEPRLKSLRSELVKVKKVIEEIERIYHDAGA